MVLLPLAAHLEIFMARSQELWDYGKHIIGKPVMVFFLYKHR
jgi:hypothetical protein